MCLRGPQGGGVSAALLRTALVGDGGTLRGGPGLP